MKVGILSLPGSCSFGCALQMFALYRKVEALGAEPEIILYSPETVIHNRVLPTSRGQRIKKKLIHFFIPDAKRHFTEFESQLNSYPETVITTTEDLGKIAHRYDRIIVGSDQVWNPVITGNDLNFYLAFSKNRERNASYAPSFGTEQLQGDREAIAPLLNNFAYLSARESQGCRIIRELTGREVPYVVDPTMLWEDTMWRSQEQPVKPFRKPYVLFYTIKQSPALRRYAEEFAKANQCMLVTVGGRFFEHFMPGKHPVSGIGPREYLNLIANASCVITNSFHGTVFSILYRKPLLVEYSTDTNSRLIHLIEMLGMRDCVVDPEKARYMIPQIDYDRVHTRLEEERSRSTAYLRTILEE